MAVSGRTRKLNNSSLITILKAGRLLKLREDLETAITNYVRKKKSECFTGFRCYAPFCKGYCAEIYNYCPLPYDPYFLTDEWLKIRGFVVNIPDFDEYSDDTGPEHELFYTDRFNHWINIVRNEMFLGGWWKSIELPYKWEEGLVVTKYLPLDDEITFFTPWVYNAMLGRSDGLLSHWEVFMPPVPVNVGFKALTWNKIQQDGFYELLIYPWDTEAQLADIELYVS